MEANLPSNTRQERQRNLAKAACARVERRLLLNESMRQLTRHLPVVLVAAIAWELLGRGPWQWEAWLASLRWLVLLPIVFAVCRVLVPRALTGRSMLLLDRHHQLEGRLSNALIFSHSGVKPPSAWEQLAIADGLKVVSSLQPAEAVALTVPRTIGYSLGLGLLWVSVWLWPAPKDVPVVAEAAVFNPKVLAAQDLDALKRSADSLAAQRLTGSMAHELGEYRELLERVSKQDIGREEVFRKLAQLEEQLQAGSLEEGHLGRALRVAGNELRRRGAAAPLAQALRQNDWERAAEALRKLSEGLSRHDRQASAERIALGRALQKAAEHTQQRSERLRSQRERLLQQRERLLKRKQAAGRSASAGDQDSDTRRQLRRLGRREAELGEAAQELSKLDRQLAEAARQLLEQLGEGQQSLQEMARQLDTVHRRQLTDEQKRALKAQLEQMRTLLRESSAGGADRRRRLAQLEQRARGAASGSMPPPTAGGESAGAVAVPIPVPQLGEVSSLSSPKPASIPGSGRGEPVDLPLQGERSNDLPVAKKAARAVALDTGEGLASTEVVYSAAARGFASQSYEKIYRDYETVAEEVLSRDQIPPGYEHSVRRYFQLIRPRTQR